MEIQLIIQIAIFVASLVALLFASDKFIDAAERIGLSFGVSPFIIGVTIVAFGTSLPEMATSVSAVIQGDSKIVIGNVIGSNIANISLVLGLVAIVSKVVPMSFKDMDMPFLVLSAFMLYFFIIDQSITLLDAIFFLVAIIVFLAKSFGEKGEAAEIRPKSGWKDYMWLALGGAGVALGANFSIEAIKEISTIINFSSDAIAQTAIALGTSLPEVVVSVGAARKGKSEIALGNVIGSNIFNTFAVLGVAGLVGSLEIPDTTISFGLPLMMGITFALVLISLAGRLNRFEGVIFLLFYAYFLIETIKMQL